MINRIFIDEQISISANPMHIFLFYIFGFLLLYVEPLSVAGLKISILWKILLMIYMFTIVLYTAGQRQKINYFIFFYMLLSIKTLFSLSSLEYVNSTIELFIKNLFFVALYLFFIYKVNAKTLIFLGKHFSILVILSFIPFILHILEPLSKGYGLFRFGFEDQFGLIGVFQRVHAASITTAFAMIVIYFHYLHEQSKRIKWVYFGLLLLGFYELIYTYVRTGIVVFLIGFLFLFFTQKDKYKYLKFLLVSGIVAVGFLYIYNSSQVIQMRLSDQTIYNEDGAVGSGRLKYAYYAIDNWYSEGFESIIIGLGKEYAADLMYEDVHNRIFAHNGYVQILQTEGLIGITLYLLFLLYLLSYIKKSKNKSFYSINVALILAYLTMMLLQGGIYFYMMMYLAIYLALLHPSKNYELIAFTKNGLLSKERN